MAAKIFETMYKCRLCGEVFPLHVTNDREIAFKAICSCITDTEFKEGIKPDLYDLHSCKDGNMGLADFLGIKGSFERAKK